MQGKSLAEEMRRGEFIVVVEYKPPRGADFTPVTDCGTTLGGHVHAILATESEDGPRMSSLAACVHLSRAGAVPMLQLSTRDLNRIALQATILGAASLGVGGVLCTVGRHQTLTTSTGAKGVFDVDAIQLLRVASIIKREGRLADGESTESPVDLLLGIDANPFADPIELYISTLAVAVEAGADFVITQPVFNLDRFNIWMSYVREQGLHRRACIIASVLPLTSTQEAIRLGEKYRNLDIRDEDIERISTAGEQRAAGVHLASETIRYVRRIEGIGGIHIMTGDDFGLAKAVLDASGLIGG